MYQVVPTSKHQQIIASPNHGNESRDSRRRGGGLVANLDVDHAIDLNEDVVLGDGGQVGDGDGLLLERVHVGDAVNRRDQQVNPGAKGPDVLAESFDHKRLLLWDYGHAPVHRRARRIVPESNRHAGASISSSRRFRKEASTKGGVLPGVVVARVVAGEGAGRGGGGASGGEVALE